MAGKILLIIEVKIRTGCVASRCGDKQVVKRAAGCARIRKTCSAQSTCCVTRKTELGSVGIICSVVT